MRFTKIAALSFALSSLTVSVPLKRAAADETPPPATQAAPPPASVASAPAAGVAHVNVNLRDGPGTTYSVVTLIPAGSSVELGECKDGWCQAVFQGHNGYIIQTSLAPRPSGTAAKRLPAPPPGYAGPPPGYTEPPPGYYPPPPGYYPPPPYSYGPYYYGAYYGPSWGWRRHYWRRW